MFLPVHSCFSRFSILKLGGLCFVFIPRLPFSFSCWVTLILFRLVGKPCFSSLNDLLLQIPPVMVWVVISWVVDVVGGCNFTRRVVFLSLRVAVSLDRLVLWGRITLHKKLMRLKVGPCLGDHFFFVIELLCLVWWCP